MIIWKWVGANMEPLPGIPGRDMEDEEFQKFAADYDARYPGSPQALASCSLYERVETAEPGKTVKEKPNARTN